MSDNPYGAEHQRRRAELLPLAIGTPCPRCGEIMTEYDDLDLGHSVDLMIDKNAIGDRIEHASCNRSAGGAAKAKRDQYRHSREW